MGANGAIAAFENRDVEIRKRHSRRVRLKLMMNAMRSPSQHEQVRSYYQALFRAWGRQQWWPARTRFEVIVGAYLTQNTAWTNVEIALRRMRAAGVLNLKGVRSLSPSQLESLIRSSGYFRQKARRLKTFVAFLDTYYGGGILPASAAYEEIRQLFQTSLSTGAEADASRTEANSRMNINKLKLESTVVGASHRPSPMSTAKRSALAQIYNEMHGLIVGVGKSYCLKSKPRCEQCPLQSFLPQTSI